MPTVIIPTQYTRNTHATLLAPSVKKQTTAPKKKSTHGKGKKKKAEFLRHIKASLAGPRGVTMYLDGHATIPGQTPNTPLPRTPEIKNHYPSLHTPGITVATIPHRPASSRYTVTLLPSCS